MDSNATSTQHKYFLPVPRGHLVYLQQQYDSMSNTSNRILMSSCNPTVHWIKDSEDEPLESYDESQNALFDFVAKKAQQIKAQQKILADKKLEEKKRKDDELKHSKSMKNMQNEQISKDSILYGPVETGDYLENASGGSEDFSEDEESGPSTPFSDERKSKSRCKSASASTKRGDRANKTIDSLTDDARNPRAMMQQSLLVTNSSEFTPTPPLFGQASFFRRSNTVQMVTPQRAMKSRPSTGALKSINSSPNVVIYAPTIEPQRKEEYKPMFSKVSVRDCKLFLAM